MSKKPQERFAEGVARFTKYLGLLLARAEVEDAQQQAHSVLAELVGAICLARAVKSRASAATILSDSQKAMKKRLGLRHAIEDLKS
jgi:TetR/AcrR family transcriptional repressor of nem operon